MAVGFKVGPIFYKVGTGSFVHCFFSNIAYHLEDRQWGSKYPLTMNALYKDKVASSDIEALESEIEEIRKAFSEYSPNMAIWEYENPQTKPPWGDNIAKRITSLSNYFYTSDGDDIFDVLLKATDASKRVNRDLEVKSL
ncbi:MAG: immunity 70 family protein [bacterium]|nr:immunity 70 family protein [bacterium]